MGVSFGGQLAIDPLTLRDNLVSKNLPCDWFGSANSFTCPEGVDAGIGHLLLPRGSLNALNLNGLHDLIFTSQEKPDQAPTFKVTLKNLCLVDAVCVTPGLRGDPKAAYLVRVADRRYLYRAIPIDKAYNVLSDPLTTTYYSATLNSGVAWTWQQMFADIWGTIPQLGTAPTLPFTPDGTPSDFSFYGSYVLDALQAVLDRLSCTLILDPLTDTFSVEQVGQSDGTADAALFSADSSRIWDEDPLESDRAKVPGKVRVAFAKYFTNPDTTGASPFYYVDENDPDGSLPGTEPNTVVLIEDDELAIYNASNTLTNGAALASRAAQRAADFFRKLRLDRLRRVYGRPLAAPGLLPGATVKSIRWGDRGRGMVTEIIEEQRAHVRSLTRPLPDLTVAGASGTPVITKVVEIIAGNNLTASQTAPGIARLDASSGSGGTLTVTQTPSGAPSIAGVTTIEIDSGLTLVNDSGKAKVSTNGAGGVVISIQSATPSTITLSGGTISGYSAKIATLSATGTWTLGASAVWFVDLNGFPAYNVGTQLNCIQVGADNSAVPIYATEEIPLPFLLNIPVTTIGPATWNLNYPFTVNGPSYFLFDAPLEICGNQFWCCATVPQWTGNTDNFALPAQKTVYLVSTSLGGLDLSGIVAQTLGGSPGPQILTLVNKGSFPISILNDSSSSTAANRILLPHDTSGTGAAAFTLNPDDTVTLWYDTCFLNNWRVLSSTCVFGKSGSTTHSTGWVPDPQSVVSNPWRFLREDSSWANIHSIYRASGLTGTFNNWNPSNGNNDTWFIDAASGNVVITGIVPGAVILDGSELRIFNTSTSSDTITLAHLNAGSAAANQINTVTGEDLVLQEGFYARLIYDNTNTRWQVLDYAPAGVIVDSNDTTPGYLASKLVAGTNITLTVQNVGGNENIKVDTTGYTGTLSSSIVTAVSCSGGTLSVTTATLTIVISKGIITSASIV